MVKRKRKGKTARVPVDERKRAQMRGGEREPEQEPHKSEQARKSEGRGGADLSVC